MKDIYLKAIMYISNNYWSVWINDIKISNTNNLDKDNEYIIKKINKSNNTSFVYLCLSLSNPKNILKNIKDNIKNKTML